MDFTDATASLHLLLLFKIREWTRQLSGVNVTRNNCKKFIVSDGLFHEYICGSSRYRKGSAVRKLHYNQTATLVSTSLLLLCAIFVRIIFHTKPTPLT